MPIPSLLECRTTRSRYALLARSELRRARLTGIAAMAAWPEDHACMIAINLRAIPHAWADAEEFWFRALYGVRDRFVAIRSRWRRDNGW